MNDETRRQRIRADKAEAELELLKKLVRQMLNAQMGIYVFEYAKIKDMVQKLIK